MTLETRDEANEIVRLAWNSAPHRCATDPNSGTSCIWFHRIWPILRRIGMVTAPVDQAGFIQPLLRQALLNGARRILVCGSADEATLEQVFDTLDATGRDAAVVVLDLCPTPLALCEALATRRRRPISAVVANILDYQAAPFDLILSHSFFGYFDAQGRQRLMAKWHALLRQGGCVVTVNRVRPHDAGVMTGFAAEKTGAFVDIVVRRSEDQGLVGAIDATELRRAVGSYAAGKRTHPVRSLDEIRAMFEGAGFALQRLETAAVAERADLPAFGPTTPGGASYALIYAVRS